jgi:hypothetical protein
MGRLLRILLNAATVLSGLLFAAMAGLWVRGYCYSDQLLRLHTCGSVRLRVGAGGE